MNGRPAEYCRHFSLFTVDEDPLSRCDLVIDTTVALEVQQPFRSDVVDEPADLVGMRLDHYFKGRLWIDDADGCTIGIGKITVNIRRQVIEPELLPAALKTYR